MEKDGAIVRPVFTRMESVEAIANRAALTSTGIFHVFIYNITTFLCDCKILATYSHKCQLDDDAGLWRLVTKLKQVADNEIASNSLSTPTISQHDKRFATLDSIVDDAFNGDEIVNNSILIGAHILSH